MDVAHEKFVGGITLGDHVAEGPYKGNSGSWTRGWDPTSVLQRCSVAAKQRG